MAASTKQRMVETAAALVQTQGLASTSFTDVLAASGAARGAIYHHFPGGKAELARELVAWTGESVRARLAVIDATDAQEVIAQFLAAVRPAVERSAAGASCAVAAVTVESAQIDPILTHAVRVALQSWITQLDAQLQRAGATADVAAVLSTLMIVFLEGAHVLCRAVGGAGPFDRASVGVIAAARVLLHAGEPS